MKRGNLRQRAKGTWTITLELSPGPDGKRQQAFETFKGNKKAAEQRLTELLRQSDTGMPVAKGRVTVAAWLTRWLQEDIAPHKRLRTFERYEAICRLHLIPHLGYIPLTGLTPSHIKAMLVKLGADSMAPATVEMVRVILHGALKAAMQADLLARNPVDATRAPTIDRPEVVPPDVSQISDVLALAKAQEHPLFAALHLAAYSGARRGEILALDWEHVNLDKGTIAIARSLGRARQGLVFDLPKTRNGRRTIDLDNRTVEVLRAHQGRQLLEKMQAEDAYSDQGLVFADPLGRPINPMQLTRSFQSLAAKVGAGKPRLHALRHFHASVLLGEEEENLFAVSRRMGHGSIATTANLYGHMLPGYGKKQADAFARAMDQWGRER